MLLTLPCAGILMLIQVELLRGAELPPTGLLVGLFSISVVIVVLLCLFQARPVRWLVVVLATLIALFHGVHTLEHGLGGDAELALLIALTMLVPSLAGVWLLVTELRR
ncbi:MAG: hypothetical protein AAF648_06125 [Pseudomonadota bacterium]